MSTRIQKPQEVHNKKVPNKNESHNRRSTFSPTFPINGEESLILTSFDLKKEKTTDTDKFLDSLERYIDFKSELSKTFLRLTECFDFVEDIIEKPINMNDKYIKIRNDEVNVTSDFLLTDSMDDKMSDAFFTDLFKT